LVASRFDDLAWDRGFGCVWRSWWRKVGRGPRLKELKVGIQPDVQTPDPGPIGQTAPEPAA